jgi:hypothetical protein
MNTYEVSLSNSHRINTYAKKGAQVSGFVLANPELARLAPTGNNYGRLIGADQGGDQIEQRRRRANFIIGMF